METKDFTDNPAENTCTTKRKRGLKPRSKRNRKRARGGVGILNLYSGQEDTNQDRKDVNQDDEESHPYQLQIDVVPLHANQTKIENKSKSRKRIRIVQPYPFTYATFAKARWTKRTLLDVYSTEFGSYPKYYYETAIKNGRITVSGKKVSCDYIVKGGDELSHVVHRHEPPVAVCDAQNKNIDVCTSSSAEILECDSIKIIHEDEHIIVVDKPSTVPVHPCGSYNFNSLFHILSEQDPSLGKLHNVHRLDRLTSGLTIIAKNTETAKILGKCINDRDECHKIYLARVKGRFPLNAPVDKQYKSIGAPPIVNGEWISDTKLFEKGEAATSFWVSDKNGNHTTSTSLNDVFQSRIDVSRLAYNGMPTEDNKKNYWFNLACPCEITCHKNGICEAGSTKGKTAQTAFAVVEYDEKTDSTVVLAKPLTGRTHQIRLHLQYVGHPIANDPNYGGDMFFANEEGLNLCNEAQEKLNQLDQFQGTDSDSGNQIKRPLNALSTDVPATKEEIEHVNKHERQDFDSFLDYLKKSCVWCSRNRGKEDRYILEFLVRSQGIWLHALQYSLKGPNEEQICYSTSTPSWSTF